jgi:hypothetical protein
MLPGAFRGLIQEAAQYRAEKPDEKGRKSFVNHWHAL